MTAKIGSGHPVVQAADDEAREAEQERAREVVRERQEYADQAVATFAAQVLPLVPVLTDEGALRDTEGNRGAVAALRSRLEHAAGEEASS